MTVRGLPLYAWGGVQLVPCERAHAAEERRNLLDELAAPAPTEVHGGHRIRGFVHRDMDGRGFRRCDGNPVSGVVKTFKKPRVTLWVVNGMISNGIDTEIENKDANWEEISAARAIHIETERREKHST